MGASELAVGRRASGKVRHRAAVCTQWQARVPIGSSNSNSLASIASSPGLPGEPPTPLQSAAAGQGMHPSAAPKWGHTKEAPAVAKQQVPATAGRHPALCAMQAAMRGHACARQHVPAAAAAQRPTCTVCCNWPMNALLRCRITLTGSTVMARQASLRAGGRQQPSGVGSCMRRAVGNAAQAAARCMQRAARSMAHCRGAQYSPHEGSTHCV